MTQVNKCVSLLFLLALLSSTTVLFAQDTEPFIVVGSGIVNTVVESLAEANETDTITVVTTGTSAGFEQFCAGDADVVTSTRAISADEDADCISNEIVYSEFLVAHTILTFVAHPTVALECITESDMNILYTPSATGQLTDWTAYDESVESLPITFILPQENTVEYVLLDSIVDGDGLRRDGEAYEDVASAISTVEETEGAIAVLPFNPAMLENDAIKVIQTNYNTTTGCASPSADNVENRLYNVAQPAFAYVNRDSLNSNEALEGFVRFVTSNESAETIVTAGFVAPTEDTYALNADILTNEEIGRLFSGQESNFEVPANLFGQIDIAGSANAYTLLDTTASQLTTESQQLVINITAEGQTAGIRRLCNGETDIAVLQSTPASDALDGCTANDINTIPITIGTQATVLVANVTDNYLSCLTTEQLQTIWGASSTETVTNWSDVDANFPDQDMVLFGLNSSNQYTDILLSQGDGAIEPVRRDTELSNDALYRAAAVSNVEGSLTYMSYTDYRRVQLNGQQNIQLVSIDGGDGCILPIDTTILEGDYPLARPASLLVNELSLTDIAVQSYIWRIFSDQGWSTLDREGFIGIGFGDLPAVRSELETQFSLAEASIAESVEPSAEATEEPAVEDAETEDTDASDETENAETEDTDTSDETEDAGTEETDTSDETENAETDEPEATTEADDVEATDEAESEEDSD